MIDDLRPGDYAISYLLTILDRYPVQVETKGSFVPIYNAVIFVTSNLPLDGLFPYLDPMSMAALERRFNYKVVFS